MRILSALLSAVVILGLAATNGLAQNASPKPEINADIRAAVEFIKRQMTIDTNAFGAPEAGLARIEVVGDASDGLCKLRCGFHVAIGLYDVLDSEYEFTLDKMAPRTLNWKLDRYNRAALSFKSATGASDFRARGRTRKSDIFVATPNSSAWSKWSEWKATDTAACRAKPDRINLERLLHAIDLIASACGAKDGPF